MKIARYTGNTPEIKQQEGVDANRVLGVIERQLDLLREMAQSVVLIQEGTRITMAEDPVVTAQRLSELNRRMKKDMEK